MAQTDLRKYGTEERLGKMELDLIDVGPITLDSSEYTDGKILFPTTEIPYGVSVPGGSGIIHSVAAIIESDTGHDVADVDIVIASTNTAIGSANAALNGVDVDLTNFCGIASIDNFIDAGSRSIGNITNVGIVAKAAAASTSLYCWGISRGTVTYDGSDRKLTLRFGIVKD
tara:strand:+ start:1332 stop:1844 length:513 start_codon:yes stop_codon:yes gene_type:complete